VLGETTTGKSPPARQKLTCRECRRSLVSSKIDPPDAFPGFGPQRAPDPKSVDLDALDK